jgi:SAM-dependent methyltransferase
MKCRICDNARDNQAYVAREMMLGTRDEFAYFQCQQCGCLQIGDYPAIISDYYPKDYYAFRGSAEDTHRSLKKRLRIAKERYLVLGTGFIGRAYALLRPGSSLSKLAGLNLSTESRILDVGCGAGAFLHSLHRIGFNDLTGADAFIADSQILNPHLRILKSDLASLGGQFDLIVLNHSLEHMPGQQAQLCELSRLLDPKGTCMIRVPISSSYAWEHYRTNWVQLDAPRHYYLHSEQSLSLIGRRAGLTLSRVVYDSTGFQFSGSELYQRDVALCESGAVATAPFTKEQLKQFEGQARELNKARRGDQAIFYFKKAAGAEAGGDGA